MLPFRAALIATWVVDDMIPDNMRFAHAAVEVVGAAVAIGWAVAEVASETVRTVRHVVERRFI